MQGIEPLFDLFQLVGGIRQIVLFIPQLVGNVLRSIHEIVQPAAECAHVVRDPADLFQRVCGVCDHGRRAVGGLIAIERRDCGLNCVRQLFGVLQHLSAFGKLVLLAGLQLRTLDLVDLEFERLDQPELLRFVHGQPPDLLLHSADLVIRLPVRCQQRLVMGKQVKIANMRRLVKQLLGVVLAVDLDELGAEPAERGDRDGLTAHAAAVFAVGEDLAGDSQLRLIRHLIFREPRQLRHAGKDRADKRLLRAGPDHLTGGALT